MTDALIQPPHGAVDSRAFLDASPNAIVAVDTGGRITYANPRVLETFGYPPGELLGLPVERLVPENLAATHVALRARNLAAPHVRPMGIAMALSGRRRDGSIFPAEISLAPVDTPTGTLVYATVVDITTRIEAERGLAASERRFRNVFEGSPNALLAVAAEGAISAANAQVGATFGYPPGELIGQPVTLLIPGGLANVGTSPPDTDAVGSAGRPAARHVELLGRRRNGSEFPIEVGAAAVTMDEGIVLYATVTDITERRAAEQALADSELRFRALFEQSAVATLMERDGVITAANGAAASLFGYGDAVDLVGQSADELVAAADGTSTLPPWDPVAATAVAAPHEIEGVGRRADGSKFPARAIRADVVLPDGRTGLILISDLAEQRLRDAERTRLLSAVDQSPDAIVVTDVTGRVAYVNTAGLAAAGRSREDVIGQPAAVLAREIPGAIDATVAAALAERGTWLGVVETPRLDGTVALFDVAVSLVRDETGAAIGAVSIGRDVTREHAVQEQLRQAQKMEAIGRLAGGIAHDFNNLLTVISGNAAMLLDELPESATARVDATEIANAADRAAALTRQLLAFSRKQVLSQEILDLGAIVRELAPLVNRLVGADVEVRLSTDSEPVYARADRSQMEQVIMNLAVNARDAMPTGGVLTIGVTATNLDDSFGVEHFGVSPGAFAEIVVSDTGVGIDRATQAHVFEPFFTTKDQGKGTGLGLATVDGIVRQSGGHIWLYSEPGLGTTFKVYLPRVDAGGAVEVGAPAEVAPGPGHETVMLVEDEAGVRFFALRILQQAGYTVIEATNPAEALDIVGVRAGDIDVLVTDVVMPGGFGSDVARGLAERKPHVGVVFMSGYADDTIRRRASLDADAALLHKPFTKDALLRAVRRALQPEVTAD